MGHAEMPRTLVFRMERLTFGVVPVDRQGLPRGYLMPRTAPPTTTMHRLYPVMTAAAVLVGLGVFLVFQL